MPLAVSFTIRTIEQLMNVRKHLMEVGFEDIRSGYNPYEVFAEIDSVCINALQELAEDGCSVIEVMGDLVPHDPLHW